jgi:hypothetical protein
MKNYFPPAIGAMMGFLLLAQGASAGPAAAAWKWQQDGNRSIELSGVAGPIVRFRLACEPRDPHFDILATADGRNLVWVAPQDHVWHYGLWFSWKYINGVNYWETDKQTGRQAGAREIDDGRIEVAPDGAAAKISYTERARPVAGGPVVLEDRVVIRIEAPTAGREARVTWSLHSLALADVELGRTPLPDEPGGKAWGGYGGFSWRGAADFAGVVFLDSEARRDRDGHRLRARWVDASGLSGGRAVGLTLFDHPGNPGHPTSWYLENSRYEHGPFWFANAALVQPAPLRLKAGESIRHAYRATVHDGAELAVLEAEAAAFAAEVVGR